MEVFDIEDLDVMHPDSGGGSVFYFEGTPVTGIIKDYKNGVTIAELEYHNGHAHGHQKYYYDNGMPKFEYFKRFNYVYGHAKEWNEAGTLVGHRVFDDKGDLIEIIL